MKNKNENQPVEIKGGETAMNMYSNVVEITLDERKIIKNKIEDLYIFEGMLQSESAMSIPCINLSERNKNDVIYPLKGKVVCNSLDNIININKDLISKSQNMIIEPSGNTEIDNLLRLFLQGVKKEIRNPNPEGKVYAIDSLSIILNIEGETYQQILVDNDEGITSANLIEQHLQQMSKNNIIK